MVDKGDRLQVIGERKNLAILGSTGSIGTQTLDVVRAYPERYSVYAICANRSIDKLVEQALEFHPEVVCIADESLQDHLAGRRGVDPGECTARGSALPTP